MNQSRGILDIVFPILGGACGVIIVTLILTPAGIRMSHAPASRADDPADTTAGRVITVPSPWGSADDPPVDREIGVRDQGDPEQFTFGPTWPDATMICVEDGACLTLGVLRRQELASR